MATSCGPNINNVVRTAPLIRPTNASLARPENSGVSSAIAPAISSNPMTCIPATPSPIAVKPATACGSAVILGTAAITNTAAVTTCSPHNVMFTPRRCAAGSVQEIVITGETMTDPAQRAHAVDRITLRHLLLSGLGGSVHFGKTFTRYEQHGSTVTAFFDDGSSATGDLLVGADGVNSAVRRQFIPHAKRVPTEALSTALRFPLTDQTRSWVPNRLATSMNMIVAPDPFFLFTSVFERRFGSSGVPVDTGRPYQSYIQCAFVVD